MKKKKKVTKKHGEEPNVPVIMAVIVTSMVGIMGLILISNITFIPPDYSGTTLGVSTVTKTDVQTSPYPTRTPFDKMR